MNTTTESRPRLAQHENSVPFFWPFTAAATMIEVLVLDYAASHDLVVPEPDRPGRGAPRW